MYKNVVEPPFLAFRNFKQWGKDGKNILFLFEEHEGKNHFKVIYKNRLIFFSLREVLAIFLSNLKIKAGA